MYLKINNRNTVMTRFNTGNNLNSLDERDFYDNSMALDQAMNSTEPTWRDRFNVEKPTIDAALKSAGFMPAGFDFVTGGTLQPGDRNKAVYNPAPNGDNNWYRWNGTFPKEIAANSQPNPKDENNWVPVVVKTGVVEREVLRRTYLEAGYNLVEGSFEQGGTLVKANDVLLQERTGKAFSGPSGTVAAGTNPASAGWSSRAAELLRSQLSPKDSSVLIADQPASVLHNIYIITGRANLANPYWGAPKEDTLDPAAATANALAIQKMLNSGARICELDEKPRYIVDTLTMSSAGQTFCGQGKGVKGLEFRGGNIPVIARPNWANLNASGKSGMRVEHMLISDKSTGRTTAWSIDLTNGDSCGLEHVSLFGDDGTALSNNYGVALGTAFGGSSPAGPAFVCHLRHSRLARAKAIINTTDSYVTENELWGNKRDLALQLGAGGSFVFGNQIVPGELYGIYLNSPSGFLHDILRIIGNYFDGSYDEIYTGHGIYQIAPTGGLFNSVVEGNSFWNLNGRGMRIENVRNSRIVNNNFVDCASSDVANTPDIFIPVITGSKIDNTHSRSYIAPKTGAARTNLSSPLQIAANTNANAPLNEISQTVATSSTYIDSQLAGVTKIIDMGRIINRGSNPEYAQGVIMMKLGVPYIGAGGVWKPI